MKKRLGSPDESIKLMRSVTKISLQQLGNLLNVSKTTLIRVTDGTRKLPREPHERLELLTEHVMQIESELRKEQKVETPQYVLTYLKKRLSSLRSKHVRLQEKYFFMKIYQTRHNRKETYVLALYERISQNSDDPSLVRNLRALKAQFNIRRDRNDLYRTLDLEARIAGIQAEISCLEKILAKHQFPS